MKTRANRFLFSRLSIQQRLALLVCSLLLACIAVYGIANYYSLKKASLIIGKDRLSSITSQLNLSYGEVAQTFINNSKSAAAKYSLIEYLKTGENDFKKDAVAELNKLKKDSTWVLVELLNKDIEPVLRADNSNVDVKVDLKKVISLAALAPDSTRITKLYPANGTAYYPVISTVTGNKQIIGYLISWKSILTTSKAVSSFSKFLGTGEAAFYIGNADGSLWTNFVKPIPSAPFKVTHIPAILDYADAGDNQMIANILPVPHTDLLLCIAFSEKAMLSGLSSFVGWIILIGVIIMAIGIIAAWVMSRSITKPLSELMLAARAISQGNYSATVPIDKYQNDELGKLAGAFNIMIEQVYRSHHELEHKVEERTSQLATVNKELEAFSYSVSHDLRTPLRAINGYSIMLKEDYENELDSEGNRIIRNIISNAKMMGQLIDDLLAFSKLGKKELVRSPIDMQMLAKMVVRDLLQHETEDKYQVSIGLLPAVEADEMMMKQVMMNLVGNAIKYSAKKDHPVIVIGAREEETQIVYFIEDNGAGFDMAYSEKLFGVFQRLHSQEDFEGSGVGLALVKRIIDKHGGEVWAEGKENAGAKFFFSLPKF